MNRSFDDEATARNFVAIIHKSWDPTTPAYPRIISGSDNGTVGPGAAAPASYRGRPVSSTAGSQRTTPAGAVAMQQAEGAQAPAGGYVDMS